MLRCRLVLESKEGCQYFEKVNIPIEGIGMYGAEQQILEEEIKTELECQNESLRLSGAVCVFVPGMVTVTLTVCRI